MTKKLVTLTALSLLLTQQALANYHCSNSTGETLQIEHLYTDTGHSGVPAKSEVTATFAGANFSFTFKGQHDFLGGYSLKNEVGENVDLEIVQLPDYGGRCGRCAVPKLPEKTYAKLTLPEAEPLTFTCN